MKGVFLIVILLLNCKLYAQNRYGNTLIFGINKGLEFTDTSAYPRIYKSKCHTPIGNAAAISNKKGKMLMYFAQDTIYSGKFWDYQLFGYIIDSTGNKIKGADSVYVGIGEDAHCVFVPDPGDSTIYWFFYMQYNTPNSKDGFAAIRFKVTNSAISVIDRKLYYKNENLRYALRPIKHGNGRDWWLLTKRYDNALWIRWLLTPKGLDTAKFQTYGTLPYSYGAYGAISVSIDGEHLFLPLQTMVTSFSFDRCTGLLSKYQRFDDGDSAIAGHNYYLSTFYDTSNKLVIVGGNQNIIRYSLKTSDTLIKKYKLIKRLSSFSDTGNWNGYGNMFYNPYNPNHLYIFISQEDSYCDFYADSLRNTISLINYSDSSNINITDKFIITDSNEIFFPAFIQPNYNLGKLKGSSCDTLLSTIDDEIYLRRAELKIYPNPAKTSFTLFTSDEAEATIYDVLGRSVLSEHIQAGYNNVNSTQWPQGVYVIAVKYKNGFVENRKVVRQ